MLVDANPAIGGLPVATLDPPDSGLDDTDLDNTDPDNTGRDGLASGVNGPVTAWRPEVARRAPASG